MCIDRICFYGDDILFVTNSVTWAYHGGSFIGGDLSGEFHFFHSNHLGYNYDGSRLVIITITYWELRLLLDNN